MNSKYQQEEHKNASKWMEKHYNYFIKIAVKKYEYLNKRGVPAEDIVNESLISIYDMRPFPLNEDVYKEVVLLAMDSTFRREKELLQDSNFTTIRAEGSVGKTYQLEESKIAKKVCVPSQEFVELNNLLYKCRFGDKGEKKICVSCGGINFQHIEAYGKPLEKCKICGHKLSFISRTYFNNTKLKLNIVYKMLLILSKNKDISSVKLAKRVGVTQKTAYYKMRLMLATMKNIGKSNPNSVLYKILSVKEMDEENPIIETRLTTERFTPAEIHEIKRLKSIGYKPSEIGLIFNYDASGIRKILRGELYSENHVRKPHFIPKKENRPLKNPISQLLKSDKNIEIQSFYYYYKNKEELLNKSK